MLVFPFEIEISLITFDHFKIKNSRHSQLPLPIVSFNVAFLINQYTNEGLQNVCVLVNACVRPKNASISALMNFSDKAKVETFRRGCLKLCFVN